MQEYMHIMNNSMQLYAATTDFQCVLLMDSVTSKFIVMRARGAWKGHGQGHAHLSCTGVMLLASGRSQLLYRIQRKALSPYLSREFQPSLKGIILGSSLTSPGFRLKCALWTCVLCVLSFMQVHVHTCKTSVLVFLKYFARRQGGAAELVDMMNSACNHSLLSCERPLHTQDE